MACQIKENEIKEKVTEICSEFKNDPNDLIAILHKTQNHFGFLPKEVQAAIAETVKVPQAKVYGIVTFYSYFTMEPRGKHPISICMGTACYVKGAEKVLKEFESKLEIKNGQTTPDGKFSMNTLRCIGACGLAPVIMIGEKVYGGVKQEDVSKIIKEYE
ncbi:TPA: NADH-quinone oxidoreductase subunit NuoE [Candidatus Delongbacteria bacterium]|nr:MAG: NAD(P)-dependent iron-only hydrogenase diaphorase iron-sulfur protein [Candidatus Delongbacteria bacterium GWF2_40_14]HAQ62161.1 NADH-quinone oxidoreductase subunit NuoE [Candidatus Delongbacteria bacterium]